ncbi:MAG: hypothetical protein KAU38_08245 [Desulfobacterales bacterium]|nr:hypothetical protein [Desulfobacterales bacterium]
MIEKTIDNRKSTIKKGNPERFTPLNRVPFGKFNRVNSEPVNAYEFFRIGEPGLRVKREGVTGQYGSKKQIP